MAEGTGTQRPPASPAVTAAGFDRSLILPMVLGVVLNPVNSSMIAVALVPIGVAFGAPPAETAWLVSALYLATAVGQPVAGRLVDMVGPRPVYLVGAGLVGVAGVLGAVAPDLGVLIAARVLLGLGTCAGYPAAMSLIRGEAGSGSPTGALTVLAVAGQVVSVVGPTLGGLLTELGGWRTTFTVNVPLSLACLALGVWRLPRRERRPARLDLPGMALFAVALTALLLFLMDWRHWYLVPVTLAAGAALAVRELRVDDPFIDLRVLGGNGPLLVTFGRTLLTFAVSYSFLYGFTQWLEHGRGLSPTVAGLVLLPLFLTAITVSAITGRRVEVRGKLVVGGLTQVTGCALLLFVDGASPVWLLVLIAAVLGLPQGLNALGNQNAMYHQVEAERMGASAGLLRTFSYLGAMLAAAANGAFLGHGADTAGLHDLALVMLGAAILFLAASALDRSLRGIRGERS
ncbi:MFS transporter [Actinophytocola xanthii]|uniref:MFS transporter n=1 Tax=Actinophytocola xanthii TaxID=1912961 RepID=A0A1Q8CKL4_9PSEU|nr:MFS transporter [Actinophytocola xanthii]OLF14900.1 MFS transporter [Actinophytocola xanthii]